MGLLDLFRGKPAPPPAEGSVVQLVPTWKANRPLPAANDYEALCADGYERNPVVWACVNLIASSVADPDLRFTDGEDQLAEDHPLRVLLDRPNPEQGQFEFLEDVVRYFCIAGESFIHKVRSTSGRVVQLRCLRPDRVEPVLSVKGEVLRYEYKIDGRKVADVAARDMIALRQFNPRDDFRGLSPISVAARAIDFDNSGSDYGRSVLGNGGHPLAFLKLKRKADPKERDEIKQALKDKYSGTTGWSSWSVIDEDADIQRFGLSPEETDLDNIFAHTETRICMMFGVPPILVGVKAGLDRSTYSNYREAKRSLWDETLSPLFTRIADKLTVGLAHEFAPSIVISWDFTRVQALRENETELRQRARDDYNAGLITLNEARAASGLPAIEGGDRLKQSLDALAEDVAFVPEVQQSGARGVIERLGASREAAIAA